MAVLSYDLSSWYCPFMVIILFCRILLSPIQNIAPQNNQIVKNFAFSHGTWLVAWGQKLEQNICLQNVFQNLAFLSSLLKSLVNMSMLKNTSVQEHSNKII